MDAHAWTALLSAAAYLCSAADDLRGAGFGAFAEEIGQLLDTLDAEILVSGKER
jgi:hypothetical protein